jgi:hypothetical protein
MGRFESGTFSDGTFCMCIKFSIEVIQSSVYTNLYRIPQNFAILNSKKFRRITRNKVN